MPEKYSAPSLLGATAMNLPSPVLLNRQPNDCSDTDVIDCVVRASKNVFQVNCNKDLIEPSISTGCAVDRHELSGIVCISGAKNITVAVNATRQFCMQAFESLTANCAPTAVDLHDTLGELANQLVGSAKEMLPLDELKLGLPTIVWGTEHNIASASDTAHYVIRFSGDDGVRLEVGIDRGAD